MTRTDWTEAAKPAGGARTSVDRLVERLLETGFATRIEALRRQSFLAYAPWPGSIPQDHADKVSGYVGSALFNVLHHGHEADQETLGDAVVANLGDTGFATSDGQAGGWELTAFRGVLVARDPESHGGEVYIGEDGMRFVESIVNVRPHGRALDVGCGTGLLTCALARTCDEVVAIDIVAKCLEATKLSAQLNQVSEKITTHHVALQDYAPEQPFNCVTANLPGVPVPPGIRYSREGNGGPDGLNYVRMLIERAPSLLDPVDGMLLMRFQSLGDASGPLLLRDLREAAVRNGWEVWVVTDSRVPAEVRSAHTTYYAHKRNPEMSTGDLLATVDAHMAKLGMSSYFASTLVARTRGEGNVHFVDLSFRDLLRTKVVLKGELKACAERRIEVVSHFYGRAHGLPDGFWELGDLDDLGVVVEKFDELVAALAGSTTVRDLVHSVFNDRLAADKLRVRWLYVTVELLVNTMAELGLVDVSSAPAS